MGGLLVAAGLGLLLVGCGFVMGFLVGDSPTRLGLVGSEPASARDPGWPCEATPRDLIPGGELRLSAFQRQLVREAAERKELPPELRPELLSAYELPRDEWNAGLGVPPFGSKR